MKASIFIAVEKYLDENISDVKYAEADARNFATTLEQHGFEPADREILINDQATKTSLESVIRTTLKRLTEDDKLYFYYAGHSFAKLGDDNYITCRDTRTGDLEHTSISLSWLFNQFQETKCKRIVMFLDSSSSSLLAHEDLRTVYCHLDEADLAEFFKTDRRYVCFTACKTDESSHPSSAIKHGIWTYHVIQAFDGQDTSALQDQRLTAASLQKYLENVVPATLRKTYPKAAQTPWVYGSTNGDNALANLKEILAKRKAEKQPKTGQLKDSILLVESILSIKNLSGFNKSMGHTVPDHHNNNARSFIYTLAAADIEQEIQNVRTALKREFKFKRLEIAVGNHGEGASTITTPYFNYNISIEQDVDDPGNVVWRKSVDEIIDANEVLSSNFEAVFADVFDTVELSMHDEIDLDELIDAIEAFDSDEVEVAYEEDENVTSCVVTIQGHNATIKVTKRTLSVIQPKAEAPKVLLQSLFDVQLAMQDTHKVLAIPFE